MGSNRILRNLLRNMRLKEAPCYVFLSLREVVSSGLLLFAVDASRSP